jgi:hypothetical protein
VAGSWSSASPRLLYLAAVDPGTGTLAELHLIPLQARQLRLRHAAPADVGWLPGASPEAACPTSRDTWRCGTG